MWTAVACYRSSSGHPRIPRSHGPHMDCGSLLPLFFGPPENLSFPRSSVGTQIRPACGWPPPLDASASASAVAGLPSEPRARPPRPPSLIPKAPRGNERINLCQQGTIRDLRFRACLHALSVQLHSSSLRCSASSAALRWIFRSHGPHMDCGSLLPLFFGPPENPSFPRPPYGLR